jgi:hypothetical protein
VDRWLQKPAGLAAGAINTNLGRHMMSTTGFIGSMITRVGPALGADSAACNHLCDIMLINPDALAHSGLHQMLLVALAMSYPTKLVATLVSATPLRQQLPLRALGGDPLPSLQGC